MIKTLAVATLVIGGMSSGLSALNQYVNPYKPHVLAKLQHPDGVEFRNVLERGIKHCGQYSLVDADGAFVKWQDFVAVAPIGEGSWRVYLKSQYRSALPYNCS